MQILNMIYAEKRMQYFSNRSNTVFIMENDDCKTCDISDLPDDIRPVAEKYWDGCNYIVRFNGIAGILEQFVYTSTDVGDAMGIDGNTVPEIYMRILYKNIKSTAQELEQNKVLSGCTVIIGQWTDPEGHEFAVFIPENRLKDHNKIRTAFKKADMVIMKSIRAEGADFQEKRREKALKPVIEFAHKNGRLQCDGANDYEMPGFEYYDYYVVDPWVEAGSTRLITTAESEKLYGKKRVRKYVNTVSKLVANE